MRPARLVAAVGVVVAGEEIAERVEAEGLRIAQADGDELGVGAIEVAAEDGAAVGTVEERAFLGGGVRAAVGDRPIDLAVGPELHAVHVVPAIGDVDREAVQQRLLLDRRALLLPIEAPEIRRAGVEDRARARRHAGTEAGHRRALHRGEDGGGVGAARAVVIGEELDALLLDAPVAEVEGAVAVEVGERARGLELRGRRELRLEELEPLLDGAQREVFDLQRFVLADVGHRGAAAIRFRDERAPLFVEAKRDGIGQQRLRGPHVHAQPRRDAELLQRHLGGVVDGDAVGILVVLLLAVRRLTVRLVIGGDGAGRRKQQREREEAEEFHGAGEAAGGCITTSTRRREASRCCGGAALSV